MCEVFESTSTEIKCRTKTAPETYYDKIHEVVVAQRILDEAVCSNPDLCKFKYEKANMPMITIAEKTLVMKVLGGEEVLLTGTNFGTGDGQVDLNILCYK